MTAAGFFTFTAYWLTKLGLAMLLLRQAQPHHHLAMCICLEHIKNRVQLTSSHAARTAHICDQRISLFLFHLLQQLRHPTAQAPLLHVCECVLHLNRSVLPKRGQLHICECCIKGRDNSHSPHHTRQQQHNTLDCSQITMHHGTMHACTPEGCTTKPAATISQPAEQQPALQTKARDNP